MHYEINVTLNGEHFFATADRSARDTTQAKQIYTELKKRFPKSEGYDVTMSKSETAYFYIPDSAIKHWE